MIEIRPPSGEICRKPVFSVVMVTYNHRPFLAEAIEGVVSQRCGFDFELVIGEDCSTDQTIEVAKAYQRQYPAIIRIVTYERNVGVHQNVRTILTAARGQYIAFCEGDDYWIEKDKLQLEFDFFRANPATAIVHGDHVFRQDVWFRKFMIQPRGRYFNDQNKERLRGDIRAGIAEELVTHTCTMSFRAEVIKNYLASEMSRLPGSFYDRSIVAYCSVHGSAEYIDRPVAAYRVWGKSMMRSGERSSLRLGFDLFTFFRQFGRHYPEFGELYSAADIKYRAKQLYLRSVLLRDRSVQSYFEDYFRSEGVDISSIRLREHFFSGHITGPVILLLIKFKTFVRGFMYKVRVFIGAVDRIVL